MDHKAKDAREAAGPFSQWNRRLVQGQSPHSSVGAIPHLECQTQWALSVLRGERQFQDVGSGLRTHPKGVETVVEQAQFEEPDELDGIRGEGAKTVCATGAKDRSCILMGSNSHVACGLVSRRFLARR